MASKLVADRQKGARSVEAVAEAQIEVLGRALGELVGASGARSTAAADSKAFVAGLNQRLGAARDRMVAADEAHESELSDDPQVRARRDDVAAELTAKIVDTRSVLAGTFGDVIASSIVVGATPKDPTLLARFAGEVARNLGQASLGAPRVEGASFDAARAAKAIDAGRAALEDALRATAVEEREAQVTLAEKTRSIEEYDRTFRGVASILSGLFVLAGEDELARKVRPSTRRPGRPVEQVEPVGEAGSDAG